MKNKRGGVILLYYVRKAKESDLEDILKVVQNGRETLEINNIPQWRNNEGPNEAVLKSDIQLGEGYVLIETDKVVGFGTITKGIQDGYADITEGQWIETEEYVSIHRFVILSSIKQKGMSQFFLGHLISFSKMLGYTDLRVDTHPLNSGMQRVIDKSGFSYQGDIVLDCTDGERKAYQLILS